MTYPNAYRTEMTGEILKVVFEDVADNIFNPDPYYQQGGDMVRIGGLGYRIDVTQAAGQPDHRHDAAEDRRGHRPGANYVVAGWASVNEGTEGPPIWDVVETISANRAPSRCEPNNSVDVVGG
jgi:sulfur-oxidizing protein SoxB